MKKRLEQMDAEQLGKLALFTSPLWAPLPLVLAFTLWGWVGVAAHFAASAWGF